MAVRLPSSRFFRSGLFATTCRELSSTTVPADRPRKLLIPLIREAVIGHLLNPVADARLQVVDVETLAAVTRAVVGLAGFPEALTSTLLGWLTRYVDLQPRLPGVWR
jgi:hypothetical protein